MKAKTKRNQQIIELKEQGWSDADLIGKFKISPTRIRQILKQYKDKQHANQ